MMQFVIPPTTDYSFRKGRNGIAVWAIQVGLGHAGFNLVKDGVYGMDTKYKVRKFQTHRSLVADGIFGPASSAELAHVLEQIISNDVPGVPDGIVKGLVIGESGDAIGAVNWNVAGGVDCSYLQRRVYDSNLNDQATIKRAFDGYYQMKLLSTQLKERYKAFLTRVGVNGNKEFAWRLAILNHNYPSGADTISKKGIGGLSTYWTTPQNWVLAIGADFPDGVPIRTPLDWCQHYSLGNTAHNDPGVMTRFVTNWS